MVELEREIKDLELEININNSIEKQQELAVLRAKYDKISAEKASADVLRLKQNYYDRGERAGKLLAWCIKTLQQERTIGEITNANGEKISNPHKINGLFESYYSHLYTTECQATTESFTKFFDSIKMPSLSEEAKATLDCPITINELSEAIDKMKGGKAPGQDGIPMDFYKLFKNKLLSPLFDMLSDSFKSGELPPSLCSALIIVILKPGLS